MSTVLVVMPDLERASLVRAIRKASYQTLEAKDGPGGARQVLDTTPDLIVMTEDISPVNGTEYVRFMRNLTDASILVVGAGGEGKVSQALFHGADAYMTRPIENAEFVARCKALLRRIGSGYDRQPDPDVANGDQVSFEESSLPPVGHRRRGRKC